jgi:murein L,D-transpeptidase YafK
MLVASLLIAWLAAGPVSTDQPIAGPIIEPRIVVLKAKRHLQLLSGNTVVRRYRVGLGLNPGPAKQRAGDNATPEGTFYVFVKNPQSRFYLSLGLSYPGPSDAERGLQSGLITKLQHDRILAAARRKVAPPRNTALGGDIFIHGRGSSTDWTWGCIALDDPDMRELYRAVPLGTPVSIEP